MLGKDVRLVVYREDELRAILRQLHATRDRTSGTLTEAGANFLDGEPDTGASYLSCRSDSLPGRSRPNLGPPLGPFHWNNRRLTFAELCRLQTFPDGLALDCGRTEMQRMLGNAVPSLIAEIVAKAIKAQILGLPDDSRHQLLPPKRSPVPPPEPLGPSRTGPGKVQSIHWGP